MKKILYIFILFIVICISFYILIAFRYTSPEHFPHVITNALSIILLTDTDGNQFTDDRVYSNSSLHDFLSKQSIRILIDKNTIFSYAYDRGTGLTHDSNKDKGIYSLVDLNTGQILKTAVFPYIFEVTNPQIVHLSSEKIYIFGLGVFDLHYRDLSPVITNITYAIENDSVFRDKVKDIVSCGFTVRHFEREDDYEPQPDKIIQCLAQLSEHIYIIDMSKGEILDNPSYQLLFDLYPHLPITIDPSFLVDSLQYKQAAEALKYNKKTIMSAATSPVSPILKQRTQLETNNFKIFIHSYFPWYDICVCNSRRRIDITSKTGKKLISFDTKESTFEVSKNTDMLYAGNLQIDLLAIGKMSAFEKWMSEIKNTWRLL